MRFRTLALMLLLAAPLPARAGDTVKLKAVARETAFVPTGFDGRFLATTTFGEGHSNHLGRITYVSPHVFDFFTGTYTSELIVTAANGDLLFLETEGQFNPLDTSDDAIADYVIVGGTGRFQGASGEGVISRRDDGASIVVDGTISTVGSGKRK